MKPAQRRSLVDYLQQHYSMSLRRACRLARLSRKAARYQPMTARDVALREHLKVLAERYPRYGYLLRHAMAKSEGLVVNRKRT